MEFRTLAELNAAHENDQAAGDFLGKTFAKAIGAPEGRLGIENALFKIRPHRAKAIVETLGLVDVPSSQGAQAYSALVRKRSLLGRLPGARQAPPLVRINATATGATASFVREGAPIPLTTFAFGTPVFLRPSKVAGLLPFTDELLNHGDPAAVSLVQSDLTRAIATAIDETLLDGLAAVADGRPASILDGVVSVGVGSPTDIEEELVELVTSVRGGEAESPAFVTSLSGALFLATLRDSGGERLFPGVSLAGGSILGAPLFISPAAGARLIFLDGALLFFADGGIEIERSRHASVQMTDTPADGAATAVALWQNNTALFRAIAYTTWQMGQANGVGFMALPLGSPVV